MVNSTKANPYIRYFNEKPNKQVAAKNQTAKPAPNKNPSDILYIIDLSDMKDQDEQSTYQSDESAAVLDLTKETQEKLGNIKPRENERTENVKDAQSVRPPDETRALTRRLVSAKSPIEVQSILADAYNNMREWQKLAATGDEQAIKVVRKLGRLVSRGNRKITDLNKETVMHQRQQRAENAEKAQLAKRLENELKEAKRERKARERRYLQNLDSETDDEKSTEFGPSIAETEAKIRQLAAAKAALSVQSTDSINTGSIEGASLPESGSIENAEISGHESSDD